jgi:hypothetical protein
MTDRDPGGLETYRYGSGSKTLVTKKHFGKVRLQNRVKACLFPLIYSADLDLMKAIQWGHVYCIWNSGVVNYFVWQREHGVLHDGQADGLPLRDHGGGQPRVHHRGAHPQDPCPHGRAQGHLHDLERAR